jgi:hypothetical protein
MGLALSAEAEGCLAYLLVFAGATYVVLDHDCRWTERAKRILDGQWPERKLGTDVLNCTETGSSVGGCHSPILCLAPSAYDEEVNCASCQYAAFGQGEHDCHLGSTATSE